MLNKKARKESSDVAFSISALETAVGGGTKGIATRESRLK